MNKKEIVRWFELSHVRGLGSSKMIKLLSLVPDIKTIYSLNVNDLIRTRIFNEKMFEDFLLQGKKIDYSHPELKNNNK